MRRAGLWLRWSWRDLRQRWLVVVAIAGVIAIGTGLATGLGSMETWRLQSNDASFAALRTHDLRLSLADGSFAQRGRLLAAVKRIPHSAAISGADERLTLSTQVRVSARGRRVFAPATLYGMPVSAAPHVDEVAALEGRRLAPGDAGKPVALLNALFARANDLPPTGTLVAATGRPLRYVGLGTAPEQFIITTPTGVYSSASSYGVVYTSLETAQALTGRAGRVNEAVVTLRPGTNPATVEREIERLFAATPSLARLGVELTRKHDEAAYRILDRDARNDQRVFNAFTLLVLFAAAFAAFNLINRVVEAQRREIGIGMALGVSGARLAIRPLLLGVEIALLGVAFGVGAGVAIGSLLAGVLRSQTALPVLRTGLQLGIFARGAAIGFLIPLAATLYPVWRGVRMAPVEAIRTGPRSAKGAGLARVLRHVPLPGGTIAQMPFRNLLRSPRRTLTTLLAVAAVITIVVSFAGMIDSFGATIDRGRGDLLSAAPDRVVVTLDRPYAVDDPRVRALVSSSAVGRATYELSLDGKLAANGRSIPALLESIPTERAMWTPTPREGRLPRRGDEILLAEKAARDLGVGVGDTVFVSHPRRSGPGTFRLVRERAVVSGLHGNPTRSLAYLDYRTAAASFGLGHATNALLVEPAVGGSPDLVERALFGRPGVASLQPVSATIDDVRRAVEQFRGIIRVAEAAALVLTLLIAFNAISISVEERRRDFATMFAYGLSPRRILRVAVVENTAIGTLGTLLGTGLGILMLDWVVRSLLPETFPELGIVRAVATESLAIAAAVGVAAMGAAPLLVVRRLRTMNIPATLRVVE